MPRRDEDDDFDRDRRRESSGGMSTTTIVLIVLGVLAGLVVAGCVGLFFMARGAVQQVQQDMQQMQAEIAAQQEAERAKDPDRLPPATDHSEVPNPLTQPPISGFDTPESAARWTILFRSDDRERWNTTTSENGQFALPLRAAPKGIRYLRLRRMDTGDTIILALSRKDLSEKVAIPGGHWNGGGAVNAFNIGETYSLGIAHGNVGPCAVGEFNGKHLRGSGFGYDPADDDNLLTCWNGQKIADSTKLEFAVSAQELTEKEREKLLTGK
jgi:type II secretory pathway pseudopilin PulG